MIQNMYGLVNLAIEQLITETFGAEKWQAVKARANVTITRFVCMQEYPDHITYDLVGAASEVLGIPPEKLLESFGEFWTEYTGKEGYQHLFDLAGGTFKEFVLNLNNLHSRMGAMFPNFNPPVFKCSDVTDNSLTLHYYSDRNGLAPMVIGLIKGIGKRFDTQVVIDQVGDKKKDSDHDVFDIRFQVPGSDLR